MYYTRERTKELNQNDRSKTKKYKQGRHTGYRAIRFNTSSSSQIIAILCYYILLSQERFRYFLFSARQAISEVENSDPQLLVVPLAPLALSLHHSCV
jgi:hypothetical protein